MIVLGVDPGETTGYVVFRFVSGKKSELPEEVLRVGELDLWRGLERLFIEFLPDCTVYEAFRLYPWLAKSKSWSTFPTIEVIGVLKYLADKYASPIVSQGANMKKHSRQTVRHPSAHVRDAAAHALVWWRRSGRRR